MSSGAEIKLDGGPALSPFRIDHMHMWRCPKCKCSGTLCCAPGEETAESVTTRIKIQHGRQALWCRFDADAVKVRTVRVAT